MPSFYDAGRRQIVVNSHKVMSTTMTRQPGLVRLSQRRLALLLALRLLPAGPQVVGVVRHPLARLQSFFGNKFRSSPLSLLERQRSGRSGDGTPLGFQHCQLLFFPSLGLARDVPLEVGCEALLATSLAQVVQWLPVLHPRDAHLQPQLWSFRIAGRIPFRADRILKLEDCDALALERELGISPALRENEGPPHRAQPLDASHCAIVNRVYAEDLAAFGYAPAQP